MHRLGAYRLIVGVLISLPLQVWAVPPEPLVVSETQPHTHTHTHTHTQYTHTHTHTCTECMMSPFSLDKLTAPQHIDTLNLVTKGIGGTHTVMT